MADTLKLEIVTPGATVYSEDVHMVTLPAVEGQIGIFPHHVPLLTRIVPGEIMVRKNGHDDFLAVGGGLVEITSGRVSVPRDATGLPFSSCASININIRFAPTEKFTP